MKNWQKLSLAFIFLVALGLRLWKVGELPTLISDEASIGYNAYSILKTGRDEWGNFLPLAFKSFGEYKLPGYIYLTVPSVAIFKLNEFSVRFPSALFGALTVPLFFFFIRELFYLKDKKNSLDSTAVALISSGLLAVTPWHIEVSRMALEANFSLFIVIAAIWLLLKARRTYGFYYPSLALFALSLYTYNSCRIFVPLFLLAYFLLYLKLNFYKKITYPLIFFFILILPIVASGFSGSRERFYKVGIFSDPGIISQINQKRGDCSASFNSLICRAVYNKPVVYSSVFVGNYLSHFSWEFLFSKGSGLAQYQVPGIGSLYSFEFPFLLIGAFFLIKLRQKLILSWLLIAPIANSLTGVAHPVRAILILPIFCLLAGLGIVVFLTLVRNKLLKKGFILLLSFLVIVSLANFLVRYFIFYPSVSGWNWQMGYRELYRKLANLEGNYDKIYISKYYGEPHVFYLFYRKIDPWEYQKGIDVVRYNREDEWTNVDQIGKYYFVQEPEKISLTGKDLLSVPLLEVPFGAKIEDKISYRDGKTAFVILEK